MHFSFFLNMHEAGTWFHVLNAICVSFYDVFFKIFFIYFSVGFDVLFIYFLVNL